MGRNVMIMTTYCNGNKICLARFIGHVQVILDDLLTVTDKSCDNIHVGAYAVNKLIILLLPFWKLFRRLQKDSFTQRFSCVCGLKFVI